MRSNFTAYIIVFILVAPNAFGVFADNQLSPRTELKQLADELMSNQLDRKLIAIEKISKLNNLPAVKLLFTLTEDKNPDVQSALLKALAGITDESSSIWLNEKGATFPDVSIKILTIKSLGEIGVDSGVVFTGLVQALQDNDLSVRLAATSALSGFTDSLTLLMQPLFDRDYWQVREEAINCLAKYRTNPNIFKILLNAINEKDLTLQWSLEEILGTPVSAIGGSAFGGDNKDIIDNLVYQWSSAPSPIGRSAVAKILGRQFSALNPAEFPLDDYVDSLLNDLEKEPTESLISKTWALGRICRIDKLSEPSRQKIIEGLIGTLKISEEPKIRLGIALALSNLPAGAGLKLDSSNNTLKDISNNESDWRVKSALQILITEPPQEKSVTLPSLMVNRYGKNKSDALVKNGGSAQTEEAIEKGLLWLIRHQEADGRWDCAKNNPFHGQTPLPDFTNEDEYFDASVTGLALLSFFGSGYTHLSGKYKDFIRKGLDFIINCQNESGQINYEKTHVHNEQCLEHGPDHGKVPRRYNHNIGTLTLVEAYALTKDVWLKPYAIKALEHARDYREPVYGWSYYLEPTDIGPSTYYIMAMTIAKEATDLNIASSEIESARLYLNRLTQPQTGKIFHLEGPAYCFGGFDSTATGIFDRLLLNRLLSAQTPVVVENKAADFLMKHLPVWQPYRGGVSSEGLIGSQEKVIGVEYDIVNQWYWYFATLSFLMLEQVEPQHNPDYWLKWNELLKTVLLKHQRQSGDWDGSWDPVCGWGSMGGRVYSTTFAILNLQAYYSYNFKK